MFGAFSKSRERSRISESAFQGAYKEFVNQIMMNEKNHEFNMEAMENKSMREILESQWAMANIEYHFVFGWLYRAFIVQLCTAKSPRVRLSAFKASANTGIFMQDFEGMNAEFPRCAIQVL